MFTDRVSLFVPAATADDLVPHDGGGRAVQHRGRVRGQPQQLRRGVGGHGGAAHKQMTMNNVYLQLPAPVPQQPAQPVVEVAGQAHHGLGVGVTLRLRVRVTEAQIVVLSCTKGVTYSQIYLI